MAARKGPAVDHYGTVNLGEVEKVFNTIIEDAEAGGGEVQELMDKYRKNVPREEIVKIRKRFFDLVLKIRGGKDSIIQDATDEFVQDSEDPCAYGDEDDDADDADDAEGPQPDEYIEEEEKEGEGAGDSQLPSSQK